ncbi:MAG: hypothetical protein QXG57_08830 [Thermofilaceae archaeon]
MERGELIYEYVVRSMLAPRAEVRRILAVGKCMDMERVIERVCPFCGVRFKYRSAFVLHVMGRHTREVNEVVDCVTRVLAEWSRASEVK